MKFKIDENVALVAKKILLQYGHDVKTVPEENLIGSKDSDLSELCCKENKVIVTFDTDFGDVRRVPYPNFPGVLVLRLRNQSPRRVSSALGRFLEKIDIKDISGTIAIIEEDRHRIHHVENKHNAQNSRQ